MSESSDQQLLVKFAQDESEAAFASWAAVEKRGHFVIVIAIQTGSNKFMKVMPKKCMLLACLPLLLLTGGCFDTKQDFTLNPDGSGKVIHESTFQNVNLSEKKQDPDQTLMDAVRNLLEQTKGVDVWRDVSFKTLDDGQLFFCGTAYFNVLFKLIIPNQTMLEFDWKKTADGGAILDLRTNKSATHEGVTMEREAEPASTNQLSADELAKKLKTERAKFQQAKPMLASFLGAMKQTTVFHLPGKVVRSSNFVKDSAGTLSLGFEGGKFLEVMEKLANDDAWCQQHAGTGFNNMKEKPAMDEGMNQLIFGEKAPVRATIANAVAPLFDYAAEVAAAKTEFSKTEKALGISAAALAPPAQGQPLKSVKVAGVRWIVQSDEKRDLRPFNYGAEYSLALLVELPGSAQSITDETRVETAIGDDGVSLLSDSEYERKVHFPKLSSDKTGVILEYKLKHPKSGVNGLKELSGKVCYKVAGGTKEVDLGIEELKADAKGTELGARIESIKEGWNKDGSQLMALKLNLRPDDIKSLSLVVDGTRTILQQNGYGGGGNSYTINYQSKQAFPAKARLVVEMYDQLQTFEAPFKLENLTLLGGSREGAK